jgi:hypothetical protein
VAGRQGDDSVQDERPAYQVRSAAAASVLSLPAQKPNGRTIAEQILPAIADAYKTKKMPVALLEY